MEENDGYERDGQPPFIHLLGSDTPRLKYVWGAAPCTSLEEVEGDRKRRELESSTNKDVYAEPKIQRPPAAAPPPPKYDAPSNAKEERDHGPKRK